MLRAGTYCRESNGAWHLFHNETSWNDAAEGLRRFLAWPREEGSLWYWRRVEDQQERDALRKYMKSELLPGEWIEVSQEAIA